MLSDVPAPIVPVLVNAFAPPLPRLRALRRIRRALGRALAGTDRRVASIASGGLSHALAFPDWRNPANSDDGNSSSLRGSRGAAAGRSSRRAGAASSSAVSPASRRSSIERFSTRPNGARSTMGGGADRDRTLPLEAGNGGNEVRTWLILAAACGHAPVRALSYAPVPEWKTGMAVAVVEAPRNGDEP